MWIRLFIMGTYIVHTCNAINIRNSSFSKLLPLELSYPQYINRMS